MFHPGQWALQDVIYICAHFSYLMLFLQVKAELKMENQRLKDENGALIRVISKLSKWDREDEKKRDGFQKLFFFLHSSYQQKFYRKNVCMYCT